MDKRIKWHLETWEISKLKPYDKNPRIITESGLNDLRKSFNEIGVAQPTNINTDGTILSGHARIQQLKQEGAVEVDVMVPDRKLTPKQEEAVIIRMNKNVAGKWDYDILANDFELDELLEWGFEESELSLDGGISPDSIDFDSDAPTTGFFDHIKDILAQWENWLPDSTDNKAERARVKMLEVLRRVDANGVNG